VVEYFGQALSVPRIPRIPNREKAPSRPLPVTDISKKRDVLFRFLDQSMLEAGLDLTQLRDAELRQISLDGGRGFRKQLRPDFLFFLAKAIEM
jgi:hypothetical protein